MEKGNECHVDSPGVINGKRTWICKNVLIMQIRVVVLYD